MIKARRCKYPWKRIIEVGDSFTAPAWLERSSLTYQARRVSARREPRQRFSVTRDPDGQWRVTRIE